MKLLQDDKMLSKRLEAQYSIAKNNHNAVKIFELN